MKFGSSAATVLNLIDQFSDEKKTLPFTFFCDNYFTTLPLVIEMKGRGYNYIGTIRANRIPKNCPLSDAKIMKKMKRGCSESFEGTNDDGEAVYLTRWKDNSVVTIASPIISKENTSKAQRWDKSEMARVSVPIPNVVATYNRFMGGTDQMDKNVNKCIIEIGGENGGEFFPGS